MILKPPDWPPCAALPLDLRCVRTYQLEPLLRRFSQVTPRPASVAQNLPLKLGHKARNALKYSGLGACPATLGEANRSDSRRLFGAADSARTTGLIKPVYR
jgi:hypothetical protein